MYYVYLFTTIEQDSCKLPSTLIGCTTDVFKQVDRTNLKSSSQQWRLEQYIGPFAKLSEAADVKKQWKKCHGYKQRRKFSHENLIGKYCWKEEIWQRVK